MFGKRRGALLAVVLLASCGGGGGVSVGDGNFNVTPRDVSVQAAIGDAAPMATLTASLSGNTGTVYYGLNYSNKGINYISNQTVNSTTVNLIIQFNSPTAAGDFEDTISIEVCTDNACAHQVSGSPIVVHTHYTVVEGGSFQFSPSPLVIKTIDGVHPVVPQLTLSYSGGGVQGYTTAIAYSGSTSGWFSYGPSSGTVASLPAKINGSVPYLPQGTYGATLTVTSNGGTVTTSVPVTYEVDAPRSIPSAFNTTVDLNTSAGALTQSLTLNSAFNDSGTSGNVNYTVATDVPWLTVSPSSGDTTHNATVQVTIPQIELQKLDYGNFTGNIIFTPTTPGVSPLTVPMYLSMHLPRVYAVSPRVVASTKADPIVLRGHGFAALSGQSLTVGGQAVAGYQVVNDTEINLTAPALAAGLQAVNVVDQFGGAPTFAALSYVDPIPVGIYPVDALPSQLQGGSVLGQVFDEGRRALYQTLVTCADSSCTTRNFGLVRFMFDGSKWAMSSVTLNDAQALYMTPNGKELVILTDSAIHVDPDTLAITGTTPFSFAGHFLCNYRFCGGMFNDGSLLDFLQTQQGGSMATDYAAALYDSRARAFTPIQPGASYLIDEHSDFWYTLMPGRGGYMLLDEVSPGVCYSGIGRCGTFSRIRPDGTIASTATPGADVALSLSDDGALVADDYGHIVSVDQSGIALAGTTVQSYSPLTAAISHDGLRSCVYHMNSNNNGMQLDTFDLTKPPNYPMTGTVSNPAIYSGTLFQFDVSGQYLYGMNLSQQHMSVTAVP